ncbi:mitochondrial antiviral-signaling protein isoform X2 [Notothenia coriiceps]|uniref:Mitochondrial antiviral-signaling protein isoform X2 n=1 Tax=Notothenia coriiceps TaxID=8208 RepID=A0A6I9NGR6_9TELE|nr:PREDICTED: mitochondrial antiviral-signaling protein isoform X2 [Notothenia coriiceps]
MSFASDKLYNGYLRRNMPTIVSRVKVREVMIHLPCLTSHDRENIEAKREVRGNYDGMVLLLDCLKRRENWPEQFIEALEACEQPILAAGIRTEYDTLRGTNTPAPAEPLAQASPPLEIPVQPQAPPSAEAKVPEVVSPPQPTQGEVEPPPSTPPPESNSHQEPVENLESDIEDVSGDDAAMPDQVSAGNSEVLIDAVAPPQPPAEELETETPSIQDPVETTTTTTTTSTEISPPQSPSPSQMNSDVTDGSSFLTLTPEKPPVQDTTPPVDMKPAPFLLPEETSEPLATQVIESSPQTETEAAPSPLPVAAETDTPICDDSSVCLSKPGPLLSIHPQQDAIPAIPEQREPVQLYSGNSEHLEISDAASEAVTSSLLPACSTTVNTALPCQENGIAPNLSEPVENHYESPCESLDMQVLENVGHISEEPSILDLDGQSSITRAQIMNGDAAKEIIPAPPVSTNTVLSVNTPSGENCLPSEPTPADISPEPKTLQNPEKKSNNTKYILTAAGVGACALVMAWRFKN